VELFVGRALSDAEMQAIFSAGSAGKCKDDGVQRVLDQGLSRHFHTLFTKPSSL
jgi:hypothetical protein